MILLQIETTITPLWQIIFTSAILSAIISGVISFWSNARLKQKEFTYNYRTYILEKRKATYDSLNLFMKDLYVIRRHTKDSKDYLNIFHIPFQKQQDASIPHNENPLLIFQSKLAFFAPEKIWLSKQMNYLCGELSELLSTITKNLPDNSLEVDKILDIGKKNHKSLMNIVDKMIDQFFIDIVELDNINKFKKSRNRFSFLLV